MTKKDNDIVDDLRLVVPALRDRIEELEDNLVKGMEALESISGKVPYADDPWDIASTTLAELKDQ